MIRADRFKKTIAYFLENKPFAETELEYNNPFELLVAVILSAQCTDKRVNVITKEFFRFFPDVQSLADATVSDIFEIIKSCSYPNNKARHLSGMANMLIEKFDGVVPSDVNDLRLLPGVGRKTANVIASVVFHKPAMVVDTHVFRVSARIGLTYKAKNPFEAEKQLVKFIPDELIPLAHHWLILHGRYTCLARNPKCNDCGLKEWCKFYNQKRTTK